MGTRSCFLALVAAYLDAAVPCVQELGAPPVIRVRVYRSGSYSITSDQGGTHLIFIREPKRERTPQEVHESSKIDSPTKFGLFLGWSTRQVTTVSRVKFPRLTKLFLEASAGKGLSSIEFQRPSRLGVG
jgi:hypothetical protein